MNEGDFRVWVPWRDAKTCQVEPFLKAGPEEPQLHADAGVGRAPPGPVSLRQALLP